MSHKTSIRSQADVDRDIRGLIEQDPRLVPVLKTVLSEMDEIPLRLRESGFAGLAHIVVAQLLSVASAKAISARLDTLLIPLTAENYLKTEAELLLGIGLSRAKYNTLKTIAEAEQTTQFSFAAIHQLPAIDAQAALCAYKGIGPWTAQVYLLFCAGHRNIFPAGDLALQKAVGEALGLAEKPSAKTVATIAVQWAPYRGSAARLLWAYFAVLKQRQGIV